MYIYFDGRESCARFRKDTTESLPAICIYILLQRESLISKARVSRSISRTGVEACYTIGRWDTLGRDGKPMGLLQCDVWWEEDVFFFFLFVTFRAGADLNAEEKEEASDVRLQDGLFGGDGYVSWVKVRLMFFFSGKNTCFRYILGVLTVYRGSLLRGCVENIEGLSL